MVAPDVPGAVVRSATQGYETDSDVYISNRGIVTRDNDLLSQQRRSRVTQDGRV
jgi:hypothetical protein